MAYFVFNVDMVELTRNLTVMNVHVSIDRLPAYLMWLPPTVSQNRLFSVCVCVCDQTIAQGLIYVDFCLLVSYCVQ